MIVGFQPGGTVRDAMVILKGDEVLPNRFNVVGTIVYWENDDGQWLLVKDKQELLPEDSLMLSKPEIPKVDILDLTPAPKCDSIYEHRDIIPIDEPAKDPYERSETVSAETKYPSEGNDEPKVSG